MSFRGKLALGSIGILALVVPGVFLLLIELLAGGLAARSHAWGERELVQGMLEIAGRHWLALSALGIGLPSLLLTLLFQALLLRPFEQVERSRESREKYIGELESAYAALKRAQAHLVVSEKMATVGRFAAGLAHEVGNPLSAIDGYSEILLLEENDPQRRKYLERILQESRRIGRNVQALLDFSRSGRGNPWGEAPQALDLAAAVRKALDLMGSQPGFAGLRLVSELPPSGPWVRATEAAVTQTLVNLLLNAQQALAGQGSVEVGVGGASLPWPPDERAWPEPVPGCGFVAVRDDGPGIPPENLIRLFDPFFTTKPVGQGTGLGLFVVHNILESLGGQIRVVSSPGRGACFVAFFPENGRELEPA